MKVLIKKEVELYVEKGGKKTDPYIMNTYQGINDYPKQEFPIDHHIVRFYHVVESTYRDFYQRLYVTKNNTKECGWKYLREMYSKPDKKYLKFMTLSWIISPVLKNMNMLTRYPDPIYPLNNNNVTLLMDNNNLQACRRLDEMLEDHMNLVPLVWKAINKL